MNERLRGRAKNVINAGILLLFFYLIVKPDLVSEPVERAVWFCLQVIIPSLFVYMVLARMIVGMPLEKWLAPIAGKYAVEVYLLVLGMLCGFPVGAKSAVLLYQQGRIGKKRAEFLCAFTNSASVSFLLGYAGLTLFGDLKIGLRLVAFQLFACAVSAVVLRMVFMEKKDFEMVEVAAKEGGGFIEAVRDSSVTMLSICAMIVIFSALGELAGGMAVRWENPLFEVLIRGFFEFSTGLSVAAEVLQPEQAFFASAVMVGFSGVCVISQVLFVMKKKLSARMFLVGRLISLTVFMALAVVFG